MRICLFRSSRRRATWTGRLCRWEWVAQATRLCSRATRPTELGGYRTEGNRFLAGEFHLPFPPFGSSRLRARSGSPAPPICRQDPGSALGVTFKRRETDTRAEGRQNCPPRCRPCHGSAATVTARGGAGLKEDELEGAALRRAAERTRSVLPANSRNPNRGIRATRRRAGPTRAFRAPAGRVCISGSKVRSR